MKDFLISLPVSKRAKFKLLAEALRLAIRDGKLKPGEVLPSTRDLARQLKMHRHTVMNALGELQAEGWIESHEKKNYQVVSTLPSTFLKARSVVDKKVQTQKRSYQFAREAEVPAFTSNSNYKYSFPSGFPDIRLFPMKEFKSYLYDSLKSNKILSYGDPVGHPRLIHQIQTYLRRIRNVDDREIVVTNGSQEAIFLLAQLLIKPGDAVAVEALGYPPAFAALKFAGAKLVPIQVDGEGLVVGDFEKQLKSKKIKMLYTTPLHQYPTTVTLSARRRLELYEVCYKNKVLILEDDYDHEFHYVSQPIAPLASFDPAGIVLYVSTFSKVLFPSARLGFMAVPKKVEEKMSRLKRISSRQNEQILQDAIGRWMESGGFEKHLRRMRRTYEERRNSMLQDLESLTKENRRVSWVVPDGGMALWMNLGEDSYDFSERARKGKIIVNPEINFRLDGVRGTHLRLGFSGQTPEENKQGLKALFSLI